MYQLTDAANVTAKNLIIAGLVAKAEAGMLNDYDYMLMNELYITQEVESKLYLRSGCEPNEDEEFFAECFPDLDTKKLPWETD
ncbi:MAG: hypothetical protein HPY66_1676 [Firmicutes bacterium]|nr:hypothetical protein [Bacillota bacterium]